ncbi:hypothetical protein XELAEV_18004800mg [Xenopus laevis]|uniref:C3H1-type domain-containing protein n=1 Tax=Xenopus laevis TaxID=8355 RepID=A0A974DWW4_XENLA|nr:hypothetical protein XELAEV_18004800mg [Xenopus laevis]
MMQTGNVLQGLRLALTGRNVERIRRELVTLLGSVQSAESTAAVGESIEKDASIEAGPTGSHAVRGEGQEAASRVGSRHAARQVGRRGVGNSVPGEVVAGNGSGPVRARGGVARAWGQGGDQGASDPIWPVGTSHTEDISPATALRGSVAEGAGQEGTGEIGGKGCVEQPVPRVIPEAAQQGAYVSFAGPLGIHIKKEESVELKDEDKKDGKKEEEEQSKRYRKIPKTFGNWLWAFCTLTSTIGEKKLEHCSPLFLLFPSEVSGQPGYDMGSAGHATMVAVDDRAEGFALSERRRGGKQGTPPAVNKPSYCWQCNEGQCKWGATCKYKHECSGCGGAHAYAKCFRRGKGGAKLAEAQKGEDPSEPRRDAAMARQTPHVLVLHAGGNDMGVMSQKDLLRLMNLDVDKIHSLFPGVVVVWSEMEIWGDCDVHLAEVGLDIFNLDLVDGVKRAFQLWSGVAQPG